MITAAALTATLLATAPKVDHVVVYPDRAQVTRRAEVPCGARRSVVFEGIPPAADPQSIRALVTGGAVEGLRTEERTRRQAFSKELAALDEQLRDVQEQLQAVNDALTRVGDRQELGTQFENVAVAMISRDLAVAKPDTKAWSTAFDAALKTRMDAAAERARLQARHRELTWKLDDLARKRDRLDAAAARREYAAEVLVSCQRGTATLELTYLVGGASWTPAYEARAQEPRHVEVSTYATVKQATGEDWRDAKILLSTAVPSQDATPPEIDPLWVYAEKREDKKVLVRREERIQHARTGAGEAAGGEQNLAARWQGLSIQLEVARRSDVPGDGTPVRLFVGRHGMPATFAWRTAPTLAPFVFRVAEVTNTGPFPLLAGDLDVFGRNSFVGRFPLERTAQGAPFEVTFGAEDGVRVKRHVLEEVKRDAGLFNQRKRFRYGYRFELSNFTGRPVEIELADRIPVSELDDVVVTIDPKTTRGYDHQKQDGVLTWKVKLAPSEKKSVDLAFYVDVPDSYEAGGL